MKRYLFLILAVVSTISLSALAEGISDNTRENKIHLNHFYVALDAPDYQEIQNSDFLKSIYGIYEQRTTKTKDLTYTGIYFYGLNTYMEFFNRAETFGNKY